MQKIFLIILTLIFSSSAFAKIYDLEIKKQDVFITGKAVSAITINGSIPGPTLHFKEGEDVVVNVKNSMDEETSIHWHGILLDGAMDGVPGLNGFHGIAPHTTFTYKFKIRQKGTYWYHSHSNLQEQMGMYGALVIDSLNATPSPLGGEGGGEGLKKDYVILLSDFTEENPNTILNNLKIDSGYYNFNKRTIFTFFSDIKKNGFVATFRDYWNWGQMRMDPTDLSDVTKYHFLINGKTADQNWTGIFKKGERIKLRFINASAMTIYDITIPGLKMKFVEADGQPIKPFMADEFRFGVAETYDVIIEPKEDKAYTIFAESLDRTGYARATLAPHYDMFGEIPKMRPRVILTMADMKMEGMNHDMGESGWADRGTPAGNKALEYSDLISLHSQKDLRQPNREIEFRFGGTMNRYIWTINGEKFPKPFHLKFGERVRLKFTNDTMMAHPIHLHGMFMQMENGQEMQWLPNKHTIIVPPAQSVSLLLTADEEGEWAFHCHLLFHMASGMMTSVTIDKENKE
ncbi:MAG TPA: multicopper oxidase domain-containing protein [Rickettsiales bacterium]|nr:multicopper oxidase domain-containing protein [Rickettsiales bacterium]